MTSAPPGEEESHDDGADGAGVSPAGPATEALDRTTATLDRTTETLDRTTVTLVAAAISVVGLVRVHSFSSVYRDGIVVLSGNDPYFYRHVVERSVATEAGGLGGGFVASIPAGVAGGEPLMVATLSWISRLLGGDAIAVGHVLAWYPVVSALVTAGLVYLLAVRVTRDRRVGVASVLTLAVVPAHAMRTGLGYADHHAFDYPWLAATALLLVVLADVDRAALSERRTWLSSGLLGLAIAGQVLSWNGAPLLLVPVGIVSVGTTAVAIRSGRSPMAAGLPIAVGVLVGAVLSGALHLLVGWQFSWVVASPSLLFLAIVGVLALGEAVFRIGGSAGDALAMQACTAIEGFTGAILLDPGLLGTIGVRFGGLFVEKNVAEALGLFDERAQGFLLLVGFALVVGAPVLVWSSWRLAQGTLGARWMAPAVYAWYFVGLAAIQVRFVGELSPFLAVFAGAGVVWAAATLEVIPLGRWDTERLDSLTVPDVGTIVRLVVVVLLFSSLGLAQTSVKTSQVTVDDDAYLTAAFAAERSATLDQEYPENYVLSPWGKNRMYNHFVSGESASYGFAQYAYTRFVTSTTPDRWYEPFRSVSPGFSDFEERGAVGYVVVRPDKRPPGPLTTQNRLGRHFGSRAGDVPGLAHYRGLYVAPGGSRALFSVVPGADFAGTAPTAETVTVRTNVTVPGASFTYERRAPTAPNGSFQVGLAYPGTYTVQWDNRTTTVTVSESAVRNGGAVRALLE